MTAHPDLNSNSSNPNKGTAPVENTMSHGTGGNTQNPQSDKTGAQSDVKNGTTSSTDSKNTSKSGNKIGGTEETSKTHYQQSTFENIKDGFNSWNVIKYIAIAFPFLLLYIYNSLHTAKAIKKKDELSKVLKELHSERISLESEITRASKQTQIAEKLKSTGLKEITTPPIKLTRERKD